MPLRGLQRYIKYLSQTVKNKPKEVQCYMSSIGLRSIVVKKFCPYCSKSSVEVKKNLLNRAFKATGINQKWCVDITYIYTIKIGWTYLSTAMDLYSRKIIGYAYEVLMPTDLVVKLVENP